jgi:hypothetical protein
VADDRQPLGSKAWRPELPREAAPPVAWLIVLLILLAAGAGVLVLILMA